MLAFVAAANLAMSGCGRTWPTVKPIGDPRFMARQTHVVSVDVLPVDVEVGTYAGAKMPVEDVASVFHSFTDEQMRATLANRGYEVRAVLDWDGTYAAGAGDAAALAPEEVAATARSLAQYGRAQAARQDVILFPYLPARLGTATGADATLYIGGTAYAGKDPDPIDAGDVIVAVLIVAVVVVVIAVAIAGGKGGGGNLASAAGNVAQAGARVVASVGRAALHVARAGSVVLEAAGRVAFESRCCWRAYEDPMWDPYYDPSWDHSDAYGHTTVYVVIPESRPAPAPAPVAPPPPAPAMPEAGPSRTWLEMTLVDNRTGQVLWHARQQFAANPSKPGDTREMIRRMLETLPQAARAQPLPQAARAQRPAVASSTNR
jgi:hypothetical protein